MLQFFSLSDLKWIAHHVVFSLKISKNFAAVLALSEEERAYVRARERVYVRGGKCVRYTTGKSELKLYINAIYIIRKSESLPLIYVLLRSSVRFFFHRVIQRWSKNGPLASTLNNSMKKNRTDLRKKAN